MSFLIPRYRVVITDASGEDVEIHRFTSLKFGYSLNRGTVAELSVPINSDKLTELSTATLNSWVRIYRWNDKNDASTERLVWYGLLVDPSYSLNETSGTVTLRYYDLASLLQFRYVPIDYSVTTNTDASVILWDIISQSQSRAFLPINSSTGTFTDGETITGSTSGVTATVVQNRTNDFLFIENESGTFTDGETITSSVYGETATVDMSGYQNIGDFGILQGSKPVSKNRKPEQDLQNRSILDVLIAFSEYEDGVDWEITPTPRNQSEGVFNTYFSSSGALYHKANVIDIPLKYFVDNDNSIAGNNVRSIDVDEIGSEYGNDILALGATSGDYQQYATTYNEVQQKIYKVFEKQVSDTSISQYATLYDKAVEELNSSSVIPYNIKIKLHAHADPKFGTFDVGDIFTFRFKYYNFRNYERQYRLYRFTVLVDDDGKENIEIELNNI